MLVVTTATLISQVVGTLGALLVAAGSLVQAVTDLRQYRDAVDQAFSEELKAYLEKAFVPAVGYLSLAKLLLSGFGLLKGYRALRDSDPKKASRQLALAVAALGWTYILVGASLVALAGFFQVGLDFGWWRF
jgi:uncharacterized membrane protein